MKTEKDFKEFIELLNKHEVRYLIVGGFAFSYCAEPRFTNNIEIFVETTDVNSYKILSALKSFGYESAGLSSRDFLAPEQVIQLGISPLRIDILTSIRGVDFASAWENRTKGQYGDIPAYYISRDDLIKNKAALGRKQDIADIEKLEKLSS